MAGASRRFADAGYVGPKYRLELHGRTVFAHAVASFAALFVTTPFVFIARRCDDAERFVRDECHRLGVADMRLALLDESTAGQADTVARGLRQLAIGDDVPLTIFNIDTFRRDFRYPGEAWFARSDGYLEVFRGGGEAWSFVGPADDAREPVVARTIEKQPISDLCSDGLYHFARTADFRLALAAERERPSQSELYVAPLYNHLIAAGRRIHYHVIAADQITVCGVPADYERLGAQVSPPTDFSRMAHASSPYLPFHSA